MKIIWDESLIIDPNNRSDRPIHLGVQLIDRHSTLAPTLVMPGSTHTDQIQNSNNIKWVYTGEYANWQNIGVLGHLIPPVDQLPDYVQRNWEDKDLSESDYNRKDEDIKSYYEKNIFGKKFSVLLSLDENGRRENYFMSFLIRGFLPESE